LKKSRVKFYIGTVIALIVIIFAYFYLPGIIADSAYPLNYQDKIKKYSAQYNVYPNLAAGLIYSESHFNPNATSPVGARGLMQIMPGTGAGIARQLGEGGSFYPDKLYDPETSLHYGIYYIGQLIGKYHGNIELALIAYNGGCGLADRYATYGGSLNPETHSYRYKVINAQNMYDQLYGNWWKGEVQSSGPATVTYAPQPNTTKSSGVAVAKPSIVDSIKSIVNTSSAEPRNPTLVDLIYAWLLGRKTS